MRKIIYLLLAISINMQAQLTELTETFEGTVFPPTGWIALPGSSGASDAEWDTSRLEAYTGSKSAYSGFDSFIASEGWLITPQITLSAANHTLSFYQRQFDQDDDYGSVYTVRVSTASQNTLSDFVVVDTQHETDFNETWSLHTVDLNAYVGQPIYIAFVHNQDDGDNWYIDSVFTSPQTAPTGHATNPTPADGATIASMTNVQTTRLNMSWDAPTTGSTPDFYDFYVGSSATSLNKLTSRITTDAFPRGFHYNTTYYWKVESGNTVGTTTNAPIWSFTTGDTPTVNAPYTIDFEGNGEHIPDGMDQLISNAEFWKFANDLSGHVGNNGDLSGTTTRSGNYYAYIDDSTPDSMGTTMLTPMINMNALTTPAIAFYKLSNNEGSTNVVFNAYVKVSGGTWQLIHTSNANTNGWEKVVIDLSSYTFDRNTTQFKFVVDETTNGYKDDFAIDDIIIDELSVVSSATENTANQFSIYPNPVKDYMFINSTDNSKPVKVEVFDVSGKLINVFYNTDKIPFNKLNKGVYLVKIYDEKNRMITQKVMK